MAVDVRAIVGESTPNPERERALDRARKLLALAEDQRDHPEGQTALKLAQNVVERWGLTELDLAEAGPVPTLRVPLGGRATEEYRAQYRAVVLAVLAEVAGCTSTYNQRTWVGKLYGSPEACAAVAEVYAELSRELDVGFQRYWMANRFNQARICRHKFAKRWWVRAAFELQAIARGQVDLAILSRASGSDLEAPSPGVGITPRWSSAPGDPVIDLGVEGTWALTVLGEEGRAAPSVPSAMAAQVKRSIKGVTLELLRKILDLKQFS